MSEHWVDAARPPKIPMTNAHASAFTPLVFMVMHFSMVTFMIVVATILFIAILSIKGRSVAWLLRKGKGNLRHRRLHARPVYFRRRFLRLQSHSSTDIRALRAGFSHSSAESD